MSPAAGAGLVLSPDPADPGRTLARTYAQHLGGCVRRFLAAAPSLPAAMRPEHARAAALLRDALERDPRPVLSCFASPAVGTPLQCLALRDDLPAFRERIDGAAGALLPHLLLEMALRGVLPPGASIAWPHGAPRLAAIGLGGALIAPAGASGLRFSASHLTAIAGDAELARLPLERAALARALEADGGGFRLERCYRRIGDVSLFATVDHNPIAAFEAHPDKAGNHVDLGGRGEDEWVAMLEQCVALIGAFMPGELAEMRTMLHELIPVGYDDVRHLSASYREAVGTVYLTLHPNLMTMTEAVIHEFQHNKLNVASFATEFLSNPFHPL
jgi:HEXXH motif-containing protein